LLLHMMPLKNPAEAGLYFYLLNEAEKNRETLQEEEIQRRSVPASCSIMAPH